MNDLKRVGGQRALLLLLLLLFHFYLHIHYFWFTLHSLLISIPFHKHAVTPLKVAVVTFL